MGRALYGHYADNVAPNATPTVNTGTEDTTYPAAYLIDSIPSRPAQLTTTTGSWVLTFAAAQRVDLVALPMHNLSAGLEVRIQGNAANVWGAPSLNETITIPAYRGDGFPFGSWLDLTTKAGYLVAGYQFWRLVIVGVNASPVKVGELLLISTKRTLNPNVSWGARLGETRPIIENMTDYQVSTIYDLGVTRRSLSGELDTTDAGLAAVRAWWQDCRGRARPFLLIPDEDVNDGWVVRWAGDLDPTLQVTDRNTLALGFEEVSRGLIL